jgi:hypothetical protein
MPFFIWSTPCSGGPSHVLHIPISFSSEMLSKRMDPNRHEIHEARFDNQSPIDISSSSINAPDLIARPVAFLKLAPETKCVMLLQLARSKHLGNGCQACHPAERRRIDAMAARDSLGGSLNPK